MRWIREQPVFGWVLAALIGVVFTALACWTSPATPEGGITDPKQACVTADNLTSAKLAELEATLRKAWSKDEPPLLALVPRVPWIPAEGEFDVVLEASPDRLKDLQVETYLTTGDAAGDIHPIGPERIKADLITPDDPLVKSGAVTKNATLMTIKVPPVADYTGWTRGTLVIVGCKKPGTPVLLARTTRTVSGRFVPLLITGWTTLLLYFMVTIGIWRHDHTAWARAKEDLPAGAVWSKFNQQFADSEPSLLMYLVDPVRLTSGHDNLGSPSRIQTWLFTVLVGAVSMYALLRLGALSNLSSTIAILLGISAGGAVLGKGADVARHELSVSTAVWLRANDLLPPTGLTAATTASWRELVTTEDGIDVQRAQMLAFTLIVAIAFVIAGSAHLANFTIPEALLTILGVSQASYVGGKVFSRATFEDLEKAVSDLRDRIAAAVKARVAASGAAPAANLLQAQSDAETAEAAQNDTVRELIKQVLNYDPSKRMRT